MSQVPLKVMVLEDEISMNRGIVGIPLGHMAFAKYKKVCLVTKY